jgi:hypothetical protein
VLRLKVALLLKATAPPVAEAASEVLAAASADRLLLRVTALPLAADTAAVLADLLHLKVTALLPAADTAVASGVLAAASADLRLLKVTALPLAADTAAVSEVPAVVSVDPPLLRVTALQLSNLRRATVLPLSVARASLLSPTALQPLRLRAMEPRPGALADTVAVSGGPAADLGALAVSEVPAGDTAGSEDPEPNLLRVTELQPLRLRATALRQVLLRTTALRPLPLRATGLHLPEDSPTQATEVTPTNESAVCT